MHKRMLQTKLMNFKSEENDKDINDLKRQVHLEDDLDDKWKEDIEIILDDYKRSVPPGSCGWNLSRCWGMKQFLWFQ